MLVVVRESAVYSGVNEHFEGKPDAKRALLDNLLFYVAHSLLILQPKTLNIILLAQNALYSAIERPGYNIQSAEVELTQEVGVVVVTQPHEEITSVAIALGIVATLGAVLLAIKTAVSNTHRIGHTLDKYPEGLVCAVCTNTLRLKLIGVCKLVQQYAASLEHHLLVALALV